MWMLEAEFEHAKLEIECKVKKRPTLYIEEEQREDGSIKPGKSTWSDLSTFLELNDMQANESFPKFLNAFIDEINHIKPGIVTLTLYEQDKSGMSFDKILEQWRLEEAMPIVLDFAEYFDETADPLCATSYKDGMTIQWNFEKVYYEQNVF